MRIGMILDYSFPPDPRVENEAVALIDQGHEVFLFSLKYSDELEKEDINGIKVCRYKTNKLEYKLSALAYTFPFYTWQMKPRIERFLKENTIEVIHIHDIQIAEAVFKANKSLNIPIVLDLHENRSEIMQFYPHLQKFPGKQLISPKKWKLKEEEFSDNATKVVVVTSDSKNELLSRINKNEADVCVIPNTVRKSFYNEVEYSNEILENYKNDFVILYIGDTGIRRGLLTAIDSLASLKDKISNIKLVIVGKNSTDVILKQRVKELKLEKYVDFQGWQNERLFPSYIMVSSIGISPLHRNLHHDTTYANKIFQYMSFGKPLLVSDAIAQKKLVERVNSGLVHEEQNPKDFADKILQLYTDKNLQKELGKNGERFIKEEFNWDKTSEELIKLYKDLES